MKIKQQPEDFIVEEIPKLELGKGKFHYFLMKKKSLTTLDAVKQIAKALRIDSKRINFAGIKDKASVAKQYISFNNTAVNKVLNLRLDNIQLEYAGSGSERLKLGQLKGNKFTVTVRDIEQKVKPIDFIENYYDDQRFGSRNHFLGKALLKREFRKFCFMVGLRFESRDYIGAIRTLGKKILRIYINSYQSYLFNEAVAVYLSSKYRSYFKVSYRHGVFIMSDTKINNIKFPVIGFITEFKNSEIKNIYSRLLARDKITKDSFLLREMPELTSEGVDRDMIVQVSPVCNYYKDELNSGKIKAVVEFTLPPGSYATLVIKKMFLC